MMSATLHLAGPACVEGNLHERQPGGWATLRDGPLGNELALHFASVQDMIEAGEQLAELGRRLAVPGLKRRGRLEKILGRGAEAPF